MRKILAATITTSLLTLSTLSHAGLITIGGRLGYGMMNMRQNNRQIEAGEDDDGNPTFNIDSNKQIYAGEGAVGGIYGRIGGFVGHYVYLAGTASFNPEDVTSNLSDSGTGPYLIKYQRSYDVGALFGIRWMPRSVLFTELAYSKLTINASPDQSQRLQLPSYKVHQQGGIIGIGIDEYFRKHLVVTVEYQHGFYRKIFRNFYDNDGVLDQQAYTPSTNNITIGLGATFG